MKKVAKPGEKKSLPAASEQNENTGKVLDSIGNWWFRFERFGQDIFGIGLIALASVTILGLLNLTQGVIISPWVFFVRRWLGLGGYILAFVMGVIGALALWRRPSWKSKLPLGRILALEGLVFCVLTLFSYLGGKSLDRAETGLDGGVIGWSLANTLDRIFPAPSGTVILFILIGLFTVFALGLNSWLLRSFEAWLLEDEKESSVDNFAEDADEISPASLPQASSRSAERTRKTRSVKPSAAQTASAMARRDSRLPPLDLFIQDQATPPDEENIHATAMQIELTLQEFGVPSRVVGFRVGPTVTQYAVEPGYIEKAGIDGQPVRQKVRISQISGLARDLALRLSAERLRIEAPVPGESFVGVEVPNSTNAVVRLRSILETDAFLRLQSPLAIALGRDVSGQPVVTDLARMPHLLIAGTTGSGKSVCIQALTTCLVASNTPAELRLAMLDPKMVELIRFNGLPHILGKVEIELDRMLAVLNWAVAEMDNRYRLLESAHARDLDTYNRRAERKKLTTLPHIVIMIDELADLMMSAPDQTESTLVRLAQMARATGIHMVIATQRPSTDVITGLIKANFPARISFTVASSVDSRVILDSNGAETLLGRGDMLFLNPETGTPMRCQGVMVTDPEIKRVIEYWKNATPGEAAEAPWEALVSTGLPGQDEMTKQAVKIVRSSQRASASMLQRRLRIGYPRAARLIDELEALGVVGPAQPGGKEREVLWSPEDADVGENAVPEDLDDA